MSDRNRPLATIAGMAETQRQPVPRNDASELDTSVAFLDFARQSVLKKADGLDEVQLRRVLVGTGTSILGLVQHLTVAESYWFGHHVAGRGAETDDWDFGMDVEAGPDSATVLRAYRDSIDASNAVIEAAGDPEALSVFPVDGENRTLRWVLAHMTSETARHAGHADILREQIDGTTGR